MTGDRACESEREVALEGFGACTGASLPCGLWEILAQKPVLGCEVSSIPSLGCDSFTPRQTKRLDPLLVNISEDWVVSLSKLSLNSLILSSQK